MTETSTRWTDTTMLRLHPSALIFALAAAAGAGPAAAQVSALAPAWTAGGYNGAASAVTAQVAVGVRDANSNLLVINGEMQTPGANTVSDQFAALTGGASTASTGAGSNANATAIGNLINVQVSGSWNTVVISATQTNTGTVSAQTQSGQTPIVQQKVAGHAD